jgi:Glycosyl transferase family 2
MDDKPLRQHTAGNGESAHHSCLPLVSIIIVNYNYGRYLREGFDSVAAQTYPNIECIIVDNASTDESAVVLREIERHFPGTKILRRKDNGGQSLAAQEGFKASSGEYVVFVDADDYLLDSFVETHVFVHLSLRIPVGFSSSDMFQAVGSRVVVGTVAYMSDFIRSGLASCGGLTKVPPKSGTCQAPVLPLKRKSISSNQVTRATGCGRRLQEIAFAAMHFSSLWTMRIWRRCAVAPTPISFVLSMS